MKTVLITGANRSIGLETAKQLSEKGLFVYLGSRNLAKGEETVKELTAQGFQNIKAIEIDVTNPGSIAKAKSIVENEQGTGYPDQQCRNSGCKSSNRCRNIR